MTDEKHSFPRTVLADRSTFLNLAGAVEGGMALAALVLAWIIGLDLWAFVVWDVNVIWQSGLALVPLLVLFGVSHRVPWGPLRRIWKLLLDALGPSVAACRWYDLPLLAIMAGIGEELLFRGVLQMGLGHWTTPVTGLAIASILFGLAHAVTPTYAVFAGLIGLYLGALMLVLEPPNLLTPIIVHASYDLVAFVVLRTDYHRRQRGMVGQET